MRRHRPPGLVLWHPRSAGPDHAAHLASYAGLAPTTKSSGTSIHGGHAPRGGNRVLTRGPAAATEAGAELRSRRLSPARFRASW